MQMADELLSKQQRALWKRTEQPDGLNSMSVDELIEWVRACRLLADYADRGPKKAAKARRMWMNRLREAEGALLARQQGSRS